MPLPDSTRSTLTCAPWRSRRNRHSSSSSSVPGAKSAWPPSDGKRDDSGAVVDEHRLAEPGAGRDHRDRRRAGRPRLGLQHRERVRPATTSVPSAVACRSLSSVTGAPSLLREHALVDRPRQVRDAARRPSTTGPATPKHAPLDRSRRQELHRGSPRATGSPRSGTSARAPTWPSSIEQREHGLRAAGITCKDHVGLRAPRQRPRRRTRRGPDSVTS